MEQNEWVDVVYDWLLSYFAINFFHSALLYFERVLSPAHKMIVDTSNFQVVLIN